MTPVYTVSVTVFMEAYKYVWACNYLKSKSKPSRDIFRGDVLLKTQDQGISVLRLVWVPCLLVSRIRVNVRALGRWGEGAQRRCYSRWLVPPPDHTDTPHCVLILGPIRHVGDVHLSRQYYLSSNWVVVCHDNFKNHIIMDFSKDFEGFINHSMCVFLGPQWSPWRILLCF